MPGQLWELACLRWHQLGARYSEVHASQASQLPQKSMPARPEIQHKKTRINDPG